MFSEFLKKLTTAQLTMLAMASVLLLGLIIFLSFRLSSTPMALLYNKLEADDSALVSSRLTAMGVPFEIADNGTTILAPVNKVPQLRMLFAQDGVPHTGSVTGYEIFDQQDSLGTSQFVYNVNLVRALEGELARTISSLDIVDSTRVHLVLPKKELFSRGLGETTASVVLKIKGNKPMAKQEIAAIGHLIATAVPNLKLENITIIDHKGNPLKLASGENGDPTNTDGISDFQKDVEGRLKETIEALLARSLGIGKVKASVAAEINFDREIVNSEVYDPAGQVLRSKKNTEETVQEKDAPSPTISVTTNIPGEEGATGMQGSKSKSMVDELSNYEISKTVTNKISEIGRIKKLSIAILVDGNYTADPNFQPDANNTAAPMIYSPRSEEELAKIKALASSAVGLDLKRGDKIDVINMRFYDESEIIPPSNGLVELIPNLEGIIRTIVTGIVFILLIMLVIRPMILRALEVKQAVAAPSDVQSALTTLQQDIEAQQKAEEEVIDEDVDLTELATPQDRRRVNMIRQLNELIEKYPEEAVAILRNWMYSGNDR